MQEIHYGHTFVPIILPAKEGETHHSVDIARFHDVEPQPYLGTVPPRRLSQKVGALSASGSCNAA